MRSLLKNFVFLSTMIFVLCGDPCDDDTFYQECRPSLYVVRKIRSYQSVVDRIIDRVVHGSFQGSTYRRTVDLVDKFGSRMTGTKNLEDSIDYMLEEARRGGLENVHSEEAKIPCWTRGSESATLLKPRLQNLPMLSLGTSIATPPEGIQAEAVVVRSFDDLRARGNQIKGKIVVYNFEFHNYQEALPYRLYGASRANEYGSVGTMIRSLTTFSLRTPHTGHQIYTGNITRTPSVCITVEDARMLQRMQDRGETLVIQIKSEAQNLGDITSRNTIAEITGSSAQEKLVDVTAHLDSWDVGMGAIDNAAGSYLALNSLALLKYLDLRPRRTIRMILWTGEEQGLRGSIQYNREHADEIPNVNFALEADQDTRYLRGLSFSGNDEAACVLKEILKLFGRINTTELSRPSIGTYDLKNLIDRGVPVAGLLGDLNRYFWYHHSDADTVDALDSQSLDKATALWAGIAYITADLSFDIPSTRS